MKKSLVWIIISVVCVSMVGTFSLSGCKSVGEEAVEEPAVEETVEEVPAGEEVKDERYELTQKYKTLSLERSS